MPSTRELLQPKDLDELGKILRETPLPRTWLAGNTQRSEYKSGDSTSTKVDLTKIEELKEISEGEGWLWIGSGATCLQLSRHPVLKKKATALFNAANNFSSPPIRSRATIGGIIAAKSAYTDLFPSLLILDCKLVISDGTNHEAVPFEDYLSSENSELEGGKKLIAGLLIPTADLKSTFLKTPGPHPRSPAKASLALSLKIENNRFKTVRIAFGIPDKSLRAIGVEGLLVGQPIDYQPLIERCVYELRRLALTTTDYLSNSRYRKWQLGILFARALSELLPPEKDQLRQLDFLSL